MTNTNCLNCEKELTGKFCSGCGQKADTHRISFKNFILHDVLHGTLHIDKGILFTAKQALMRPGQAALDYISGKRIRYYNVFYLVLITFGLILFLRHFYEELVISQGGEFAVPTYPNEASKTIDGMLAQKSKLIVLLFVPFAALSSFILFRRKKLNLSEHFIISGMVLLGMLLLSAFGNIAFYLNLLSESDFIAITVNFATPTLVILYVLYGYYNAFGSDYSNWGITYRIFLFFGLFCLEVMILLYTVIGFVTNWEFGTVTITPFG